LAGEVGKLAARQEKDQVWQEPDDPGMTYTPPPAELREAFNKSIQGYSNA
jgi:hypothetical protein